MSAAQEARIKFPHVFTTYSWNLAMCEQDHFDSSLPLVSGHVAWWGFHIALTEALVSGDTASVVVLVQVAFCAPVEGVITENEDKLSMISMERSDAARIQYDYLKNTFPAFARKLMVALEGVSPTTAASASATTARSCTGACSRLRTIATTGSTTGRPAPCATSRGWVERARLTSPLPSTP